MFDATEIMIDKLETIKIFIQVAKHLSFSKAAEAIGISAPAVTRAIAALEQRLQVKLLSRTTRLVRLTEAGANFYHECERILEELEYAEAIASGGFKNPSGILTVTAPVMFGQKHVISIVNEYLACYPDVSVKAMFFDRVSNLLEEKIDVAVRIGELKDSTVYAQKVGYVKKVLCASPAYLREKGLPSTPENLKEHDVIFPLIDENTTNWHFEHNKKKKTIKLHPRLCCNQVSVALESALNGNGITRLMSYQIGEELEKGTLVRLLADYEEKPLPVSIMYMEGRRASAKTRAFIDLAAERLRNNPFISLDSN